MSARLAAGLLATCLVSMASAQVAPLGMRAYDPFINGGTKAAPETARYMAAIIQEGASFPAGYICSGTVIADGWVLTAAHCTFNVECQEILPQSLKVSAGVLVQTANSPTRPVTDIRRHENFQCVPLKQQRIDIAANKPLPMGHDIALLRVPAARAPTPRLYIASAASQKADVDSLFVGGWGTTKSGSGSPSTLQSASLSFVDTTTCSTAWQPSILSTDLLCAAQKSAGTPVGVCSGDSGGPLVGHWGTSEIQLGVVSFGPFQCSTVDRPNLFTDVAMYWQWISTITGKGAVQAPSLGCTAADIEKRLC
ncbi:Trypsin [Pandoraea horticolens]|uniref:Trypsin n=1 Tax=Pandoraea horticolens TaxID=2508298 RepID=A0A5E4Z4M1_9BURK|nr:serine protease [Pandoraea horticolens]VVE55652.1 Trypsin [Pandoraea horticolens]